MDETTPPAETTTAPETPPEPCCAQMVVETLAACSVCGKPTCKNCRSLIDLKKVCNNCIEEQVAAQIAAEKPDASRMLTAVVGGAAGALVGGALWAAVVIITNYEVGYVAIGVGVLAGYGTVLGAGGRKGGVLQAIAVLAAVLGLVAGKYFGFAHQVIEHVPEFADASYVDGQLIQVFSENLTEFVSGFDIIWLLFALGAAFKIPAPTQAIGKD